jgi:hypothetical protein
MGFNIHMIFLFKREWLFTKRIFSILLFLNIGLFILGYVLQALKTGEPNYVIVLKAPLLSQCIFWLMKVGYYKMFNTNPQDSFWSMDIKLMKDGIFNSLFWIIGLILPMILIIKVLP